VTDNGAISNGVAAGNAILSMLNAPPNAPHVQVSASRVRLACAKSVVYV
jgi:hypothetical protein